MRIYISLFGYKCHILTSVVPVGKDKWGWCFGTEGQIAPGHNAVPSVHLELKRIAPVFEIPEKIRQIGVIDRLARVIRNQVLL